MAAERTIKWRVKFSDRLWPEDDRGDPDRLKPYHQQLVGNLPMAQCTSN